MPAPDLFQPDPGADPMWKELANHVGEIAVAAGGSIGLMMIERQGAAAAMIAGMKDNDSAHVLRCLKLFHERLGQIIAQSETVVVPESSCWIHDSKTNTFRPSPGYNKEQN